MSEKRDIGHSLPLGELVNFVRKGGAINLSRHVNKHDLAITTEGRSGSNRVESECSGGDHFLPGKVTDDNTLFYLAQFIAELCGVGPESVESYRTVGDRKGYRIIGPKPKRRTRKPKIDTYTSTGASAAFRTT